MTFSFNQGSGRTFTSLWMRISSPPRLKQESRNATALSYLRHLTMYVERYLGDISWPLASLSAISVTALLVYVGLFRRVQARRVLRKRSLDADHWAATNSVYFISLLSLEALAIHTFNVLVMRWRALWLSIVIISPIWIFPALNVGLSTAIHPGNYYGNTGYCGLYFLVLLIDPLRVGCWIRDEYGAK
ncbi:uncharacterized protein BT62DRAFT_1003603 [Guyanagaster necrorhizus]|uniref:Uncharacterized protein n=1 Tax=Guyanagaster necrorhizus TaxID=856835 RepID=A0A9P8AV27_9AGAR|nr:uncharacterized protein BT62DRAFT_1003603 [Guyanagaster necrorhizus MCA 3950]KAG7448880.1 hypothetical protein BT62DRAFT_1003603 [Guyanagaster necrorhizus MCA 3950]